MADALQINEFVIDEDPPGTRRWINWFDDPRPWGTRKQSAQVTVRLGALPEGIDPARLSAHALRSLLRNDVKKLRDSGIDVQLPAREVRIDAGWIPGLEFGAVYENGSPAGRLRLQRRSFTFRREETDVTVLPATAGGVAPAPDWFTQRWRVLSWSAYRRGDRFGKARLLVLRNRRTGETLQIPCSVVFAAFYGWHAIVARALLRDRWERSQHEVVNPKTTFPTENGGHIGLRYRLKEPMARQLHLMLHDETGRREVDAIHPGMLAARSRTSPSRDEMDFAPFETGLPFDWSGEFRLRVRGFRLYPTAEQPFVGLRIIESSWPLPGAEIVPRRDVDPRVGRHQEISDERKPFAGMQPPEFDDEGPIDTDPFDDPAAGLAHAIFEADGAGWIDPPPLIPYEKAHSKKRLGPVRPKAAEPQGSVSFGEPTGLEGEVPADAVADQSSRSSSRFDGVTAMLDRLQFSGRISTWKVVPPPAERSAAVGDWQAWRFPLRPTKRSRLRRWALLDPKPSDHPGARPNVAGGRRRTLLALTVRSAGQSFLVAVVEPRPGEEAGSRRDGFRSITCQVAAPMRDCVLWLLVLGLKCNGHWPDPSDDRWRKPSVTAMERWQHWPIEAPYDRGGRKSWLSPEPFLASLRAIGAR